MERLVGFNILGFGYEVFATGMASNPDAKRVALTELTDELVKRMVDHSRVQKIGKHELAHALADQKSGRFAIEVLSLLLYQRIQPLYMFDGDRTRGEYLRMLTAPGSDVSQHDRDNANNRLLPTRFGK